MILGAFLLRHILLMKADKIQDEMEAKLHTISFNTDGGKAIAPVKAEYFASISNIRAEKEGYIFKCWLLDGQPIDYSFESLTQDVTLTASYIKSPNTDNNNSNNNSNNLTTQDDVRKTYPINKKEQITTGFGLKFAVTVINYQTESNSSKLGKTESDQEFVIVNMEIENLGSEPLVISKNDFRLEDASGSRYYAATRTLELELTKAEIGVGQSKNISVRFVYWKDFSKSIVMYPDVYYETTIKLK